jgi:hypothetical protein
MSPITISPCPQITKDGGEIKISNTLHWGDGKSWDLEFSFDNDMLPLTTELDPWLVVALLPAMGAGMDLELSRPVSARLLQNLPTIQAIFNTWDATYQKVKVTAPARSEPIYGGKRKTACFFSGGIDSFYTVLRHQAEIDVLIHLDNPWAGAEGRARMNGKIKEAAHRLGKELIIVKSNFRGLLDKYTNWDYSHGAALIAQALFLAPYFSKVFVASTYYYANLQPNGTHPLLDPLWSTEGVEVVHDGAEKNRPKKIESIAHNEIMLSSLRVCWENIENEKNCGRCRKCLFTMVSLRTAGVLDHCTAFAVPLDLEHMINSEFKSMTSRQALLECLQTLQARGADPELETAIRRCLARQAIPPQLKPIVGTDPEVEELRRKVAYYDQTLRFQVADKVTQLLSKNRAIHRAGEALAQKVWKILK